MSHNKAGKYACYEYELRFLLKSLPVGLESEKNFRDIEDKYFPETQLRFRTIRDASGNLLNRKLTQKSREVEGLDFSKTIITNIYLSDSEAALFNAMPGYLLKKKRYSLEKNGVLYSIDLFTGIKLILAELEFESEQQMRQFKTPFVDWTDVSQDEHFTGGYLASQS